MILQVFAFDALWGHRRNPEGYAKEVESFDVKLGELLKDLKEDDLLMITADHGNDPTGPVQTIRESRYRC